MRIKVLFAYVTAALVISGTFSLPPLRAASGKWNLLETKYVKIYYQNQEDIEMFDKKIDYDMDSQGFGFFGNKRSGADFEDELKKKIDSLYERVQAILDMRKAMKKVSVKIYTDENALWDAYEAIYQKRKQLRAWYIFEYHTVYVNREDLNEGILAHEIAHAVIDNYLDVRPPAATAEILARYVDMHLFED
ncbi:conserved exported hypothetical protein [Desulfamplus magnetovallimortis]|uniref:Peptidase MA-like domain-containing protein n=1 Tax=Desulfamplus magnetovallimortis TaxID=1246637 RepID=A0A1W1HBN9_9BACT|nr:hypothetical protein [Desulfamplus magnetovallimortis]SLM29907.1 conserved exported hypothetical protein [Desulfamplus magnetovallimortis]